MSGCGPSGVPATKDPVLLGRGGANEAEQGSRWRYIESALALGLGDPWPLLAFAVPTEDLKMWIALATFYGGLSLIVIAGVAYALYEYRKWQRKQP